MTLWVWLNVFVPGFIAGFALRSALYERAERKRIEKILAMLSSAPAVSEAEENSK